MIHHLFERIDKFLSEVVPMIYLLGAWSATAYFFSQGDSDVTSRIIAILLAGAVEIHFFLQQRRVKAVITKKALWSQEGILHVFAMVALGAFGIFNNYSYLADTWKGHTSGEILLRASAIYVFYMLTGALTPLKETVAEAIKNAAELAQRRAVTASQRTWLKKIKNAEREGKDLGALNTELLKYDGETQAADRNDIMLRHLADDVVSVKDPVKKDGGKTRKTHTQENEMIRARAFKVLTAKKGQVTVRELAKALHINNNLANRYLAEWRAAQSEAPESIEVF